MSDLDNLTAPGIMDLTPYVPGKPIEELERELGIVDTLKLASNENPLGASPLGIAAATSVVSGINLYSDDMAFRLKNKLAAMHGVRPEHLIMGNGSSDVLNMVSRAFLSPGVNAVFSKHSFAMYPIFTTACGAAIKETAVYAADHETMPYGADLDALANGVDKDTRVVFIANPNNPTGTWSSADALKNLIKNLPSYVIVVLDEAYIEYVEDEEFADGIKWLNEFPNLLVTRTFSKLYGLAGLRIGYGIANPELASIVNRLRHPFNVNMPALAAAAAALDDHAFIKLSRDSNTAGLKQLANAFEAMNLKCMPSVANFITVDIKQSGMDAYDELLKKGVIVRPVANYDLPHHLRITVGTETDNKRVIKAISEVLGL